MQGFSENDDLKEEFYEMIHSYEVIPLKFINEYKELKKNKKFFEMEQYSTTISTGQFHKLLKNKQILIESEDFFVDSKYDGDFGLQIDIPEGMLFDDRLV